MAKNELTMNIKIDEKDIDDMVQEIVSNFFKFECKDCSRSFLAQKDDQHPKEAKVCPYCTSEDIFIIDDPLED
jgi:Zn finger protein HypA/HybF involved in hydrogenase expression